jgi:hypothetical protein
MDDDHYQIRIPYTFKSENLLCAPNGWDTLIPLIPVDSLTLRRADVKLRGKRYVGWKIETPGDYQFDIYYEPQQNVNNGVYIGLGMLIVAFMVPKTWYDQKHN